MKKAIYICLILLFAMPTMAAPVTEDSGQILQTVWQAQSIDGLNNGIWVIPEEALNQYFAAHAEGDKVKNPSLKLLANNKMFLAFDSSLGRVGLTCEVKQFVHNETESYAEVYVRKKEITGQPMLSWMLKFVSLGALADLYGNPLRDVRQVDAQVSGNTLKVNFRPLIDKSLLQTEMGKKVEVSSITTREGALELHTNMKAETVIGVLMGNL